MTRSVLFSTAVQLAVLTCLAAATLTAAEVPSEVLVAEKQRVDAVAQAVRSTVAIFTPDGNGGGSGVVISPDGYAISNFHVTSPVGEYLKCGMADGRLYDAVIVSIDPTGDVAMVKLLGREDFVPAKLGDSDQVRAGDWCFAVGNPFLLATDFQPSVSFGMVSGVHRYQYPAGSILEYTDCIQTDAAINPGNSGGPLFNAQGELIGIIGRGSFEKRGRVNVGVGYAISINQVKNFLGHLHSGAIVDHATLGATVDRDEQGRVVVSNILESSDAYRRGLRYGDELIAFGGRQIASVNAFKNVLGIFPAGWRVPLSYRRDGERIDTYVRLASVHSRAEMQEMLNRQPEPEEIPGGPPPDRDPNKKQGDTPPQPRRLGPPREKPKVEIPPEIAKWIVPRSGFVNFHFNGLNRHRVWNQFTATGDYASLTEAWKLSGQLSGGGDFSVILGETESKLEFPGVSGTVVEGKDLSEQLEPGGSGLLAALHLWRRMLLLGPQKFGDVRYLGTAPIPDHDGLFDVLVGTYNVAEIFLYFDPKSGRLIALELFPDAGTDGCELLFEGRQDAKGQPFPQRILVRRAGAVVSDLKIAQVDIP